MPIQPRNPQKTFKDQHKYKINHKRPAQIIHSPAQHMQKEPPSHQFFLLSLRSPLPKYSPDPISKSNWTITITITNTYKNSFRTNQVRNPLIGITLCTEPDPSKITDHQLKTILKPLYSFRHINEKNISNPYLFRDAAKVTTFVRAAGNRTRELWRFIQEASCADLRLAELEHSSLKKMLPFCSGRVPILVHPSFYRSLKLRYPMDVGGITRDD